MASSRVERTLAVLIDKLTDKSKDDSDDHSAVQRLKLTCKQGGEEVATKAFALILQKLRTTHSKVITLPLCTL